MKKIIYLLITITILGCSSDNNSETPINNTSIKLVKEVELDLRTNKTQVMDYSYTEGILNKTEETESNGDIYKTLFNYENDKLKSLSYFTNGVLNGSKIFEYDNERKIRSSISTEDNITFQEAYAYDNANNLIAIQNIESGKLQSQKLYSRNNSTINGQNSFTETYYDSSNNELQKILYESDLENNPYLEMFPSAYANITLQFSVQNIAKKTIFNGDISTYEYIYNKSHRPTQMIEKINGVAIKKTTFSYQ